MRSRICLSLLLFVSLLNYADAQDPAVQLQKVADKNALDGAGKPPFHLKLSFLMYDLAGNTSDTGTVEEWWAGPGRSKTVITAASLKSADAVSLDSTTAIDPRERYFVQSLLQAEVHPVRPPTLNLVQPGVEKKDTVFSGITLACFNGAPRDEQGTGRQLFSYCFDKSTDALRFVLEKSVSSMARNQIGSFHDTEVALGIEIAYQDRIAIKGKVDSLQSFDPAKSQVELSTSEAAVKPAQALSMSGFVTGEIVNRVPPSYPRFAQNSHISGTVVLHAIISKQGSVQDLFALASPHPSLTAAAIEAVRQWKYRPYLVNGDPVEVDTVINVNFRPGIEQLSR